MRIHTTTLGEVFAISRGKLFDCNALWMEMKREGAGAGRAYHDEDEKMSAAEETMDDDGRVYIGSRGRVVVAADEISIAFSLKSSKNAV